MGCLLLAQLLNRQQKRFLDPLPFGGCLEVPRRVSLGPFLLPTSFYFQIPLLWASPHPSDGEATPHWQVVQDKVVVHCVKAGCVAPWLTPMWRRETSCTPKTIPLQKQCSAQTSQSKVCLKCWHTCDILIKTTCMINNIETQSTERL